MSTTTSAESPAFALARQALALVGEHQTPPSPKVYEVWYRYVEGSNESITQQLNHAIKQSGSVTVELLEQLYDQFCTPQDSANDRVSLELSKELVRLQGMITNQRSAGQSFNSSISSANEAITAESDMTPTDIARHIGNLVQNNQSMQSQLSEMDSRLQESQSQVANLRKDLVDSQKTMMTDPLTGLGNRRFFDTLMNRAVSEDREASNVFLLLIDLDEFKEINDTFGHSAGDQVLRFVASETAKFRSDVSMARYGGDEFAVFLNTNNVEEATEFADQIRKFFSTNSLRLARSKESLGRIRLSIGVARLRPDDDASSWFDRADGLLYRAKESGRNCVMVERSVDL